MRFFLENVSFSYAASTKAVLEQFSLEISGGEAVAIVGPSGSGKSTVLGVLGRVLVADAGEVGCQDERGERLAVERASWILQSPSLLNFRSVLDNAALECLARGWSRETAQRRAIAALTTVQMADLIHRRCISLSGGQAQRVAVARALAARPSLVLADEPTAQLDPGSRLEVVKALLATSEAGAALLVATHDPFVAESCDRVVRLA